MLRDGKKVNKSLFSMDYEVSERGFDRDIQDIRLMLSDMGIYDEVLYDKSDNTYYLTGQECYQLDEAESYILVKLLLNSNAFRKDEAEGLIETLVLATDKHKRKLLIEKLKPDMELYDNKNHEKAIVKLIQDLSNCIIAEHRLEIYCRDKSYRVKPIRILCEKNRFKLYCKNDDIVLNVEEIDRFDIL